MGASKRRTVKHTEAKESRSNGVKKRVSANRESKKKTTGGCKKACQTTKPRCDCDNSMRSKSLRRKKDHRHGSKPAKDDDREEEKKKESHREKDKKRKKVKKKERIIQNHPDPANHTVKIHHVPPAPPPSPNVPKPSTPGPKEKLRFDSEKKLVAGTKISVPSIEIVVLKLLGSGGFGDVYLVEDPKQNRYAMKTEYERPGSTSRIKMEVKAYDKISKLKKDNPALGARLLGFFGSGSIENIKFFIMSLVGPSIEDLVTKYEICFGTALRLCIECFDGIVDLHNCGFIHRDIKPENYSIGLNAERRRVYLVDLGMVCRVILDAKEMPASSKYDFIGTQLYAPRTSHLGNVQTRKDDLESWLYSCIDMFAPNKLPWSHDHDRHKVCDLKEEFFKNPSKEIMQQLPGQFEEILKKIDAMGALGTPDYKAIRDLLDQAAKEDEIDFNEPFEWESGDPPKRKEGSGGVRKKSDRKGDEGSEKDNLVDDVTQATIAEKEITERILAG